MAGLNTKETEDLRTVKKVLEKILRDGYEPAAADIVETEERKKDMIVNSISTLRTVINMKGYFPS